MALPIPRLGEQFTSLARELSENGDLSDRQRYDRFAAFARELSESGALSFRERAVAALAAALTWEDAQAVRQAITDAEAAGLSNREIGQVGALVASARTQKTARSGLGNVLFARRKGSKSTCC